MGPVIVSLTTIPSRNGTLEPTIRSLRAQTRKPDDIRLYLPPLAAPIVGARCIELAEDPGPAAKISAVRDPDLPPDAVIVTVDDDQIYEPRWLETLLVAARNYPDDAVGMSGWNVEAFLDPRQKDRFVMLPRPGVVDVLEGFAGVAYRKRFFDESLWDIPETCRYVDDVWISGYLRRRGVGRRVIGKPMVRGASPNQHGLHKRPDFMALNKRAAEDMFGQPAARVEKGELKLTICIMSLHVRHRLLTRLLSCIRAQRRVGEVEILTAIDAGQLSTGTKRNRLVDQACGRYIVHVDDDDLLAADYLEHVLSAIDEEPSADAILIRGRRSSPDGHKIEFDYDLGVVEGKVVNGVMWRLPGHLCPVRADIAKSVRFEEITFGEDLDWSAKVHRDGLVKNVRRAGAPGQILYFYEWTPGQTVKRGHA